MRALGPASTGIWSLKLHDKDADKLRTLIDENKLSAKQLSNALIQVAGLGWEEGVDLLLGHADPKRQSSRALLESVDYPAIVAKLVGVSQAKANRSLALRMAFAKGQVESVRLLLPHSDPADMAFAMLDVFRHKVLKDSKVNINLTREEHIAVMSEGMRLFLPHIDVPSLVLALVAKKRDGRVRGLDRFLEDALLDGIAIKPLDETGQWAVVEHLPRTHRSWQALHLCVHTEQRLSRANTPRL